MASFFPSLLRSQLTYTPPVPTTDCTGKTVIVTGANVGLGKEAVAHFVQLNAAKVIIACRSVDKGEAARAEIEKRTGRTGVVEVWPLDLQDYDNIRRFVKRASELPRIDMFLANAGMFVRKQEGPRCLLPAAARSFPLIVLGARPLRHQRWRIQDCE